MEMLVYCRTAGLADGARIIAPNAKVDGKESLVQNEWHQYLWAPSRDLVPSRSPIITFFSGHDERVCKTPVTPECKRNKSIMRIDRKKRKRKYDKEHAEERDSAAPLVFGAGMG